MTDDAEAVGQDALCSRPGPSGGDEVHCVTVADDVADLRETIRWDYVRLLVSAVSQAWQCVAFRMHCNKARARDPTLWTHERYLR